MSDIPNWVKKYPHKTYKFSKLPIEAKKAIVVYMFGARAQVADIESGILGAIVEFNEVNGDARFSIYNVPIHEITDRLLKLPDIRDAFENFDELHRWYLKNQDETPRHKSVWPLIGSDDEDYEVYQDGSHRLHSYYRAGKRVVPMLYFLDDVENVFGRS